MHGVNADGWMKSANQNESVSCIAFGQYIEQPMHAIVQIGVDRSRRLLDDKLARLGPNKGMTRFVAELSVCFSFNDDSTATIPQQRRPD